MYAPFTTQKAWLLTLISTVTFGCDTEEETPNRSPIAKAASSQKVDVGASVMLSGVRSSDPDGDKLSYQWTIRAKPESSVATLSNPAGPRPSIVIDTNGSFEIDLVVNDGKLDSEVSTVTITTNNRAPVAVVGPDHTIHSGDTVMLDGSQSSDPDADSLTYLWSLVTKPGGSNAQFSDAQIASPSFTPDIDGAYIIQLVVNDGGLDSVPATMSVEAGNFAPTAVAGPDQRVDVGVQLKLDASGSSDPENDPLNFRWSIKSQAPMGDATLSDTAIIDPTFIASEAGDYEVQLIVNDGFIDSPPDTILIRYGANLIPLADAGDDQSSFTGRIVRLNGENSSDGEGDPLTYSWRFANKPTGSNTVLLDSNQATPMFTPDVAGAYVVELVVSDMFDSSPADTVVIMVAPVTPDLVLDVAAGQNHTCAILGDGNVRCWGANNHGQLGNPSLMYMSVGRMDTPSSVGDIEVGSTATAIVAGQFHSCAILGTGNMRCWGNGGDGRLGYGNLNSIGGNISPQTAGDINLGANIVIQASAGHAHTCALFSNKKVMCWGLGSLGQLGYADISDIGDTEAPASAGYVDVGGDVVQIETGNDHTCALLTSGAVRCWGQSTSGQLGYGNRNRIGDDETPASAGDVNIGGLATQIAAGANHTCALLTDQTVRCWGSNSNSQTGEFTGQMRIGDDEPAADSPVVRLSGPATHIFSNWAHNCAILDTGNIECWGLGGAHLGNRSSGDVGNPAAYGSVNVGAPVSRMAIGAEHTCAITDTRKLRCWGTGTEGALGYGNSEHIGDNESPASAGDVPVY